MQLEPKVVSHLYHLKGIAGNTECITNSRPVGTLGLFYLVRGGPSAIHNELELVPPLKERMATSQLLAPPEMSINRVRVSYPLFFIT